MSEIPGILKSDSSLYRCLLQECRRSAFSHAYLFWGPSESICKSAAYTLAVLAVCPDVIESLHAGQKTAENHVHRDISVYVPQSTEGYGISQVRALTKDSFLAPVRSSRKVYILEHAESLKGASANALLKTLEEPPESSIFILCASDLDLVLETIVSRCRIFACYGESFLDRSDALAAELRISCEQARLALYITGSYGDAKKFLQSQQRQELRHKTVSAFCAMYNCDSAEMLANAEDIVNFAQSLYSGSSKQDEYSEFLSAAAKKELESAKKREFTQLKRSAIIEVIAHIQLLLGDMLAIKTDVGVHPANYDCSGTLRQMCEVSSLEGILRAIDVVQEAFAYLGANVNPRVIIEVMLLDVMEALVCSP